MSWEQVSCRKMGDVGLRAGSTVSAGWWERRATPKEEEQGHEAKGRQGAHSLPTTALYPPGRASVRPALPQLVLELSLLRWRQCRQPEPWRQMWPSHLAGWWAGPSNLHRGHEAVAAPAADIAKVSGQCSSLYKHLLFGYGNSVNMDSAPPRQLPGKKER